MSRIIRCTQQDDLWNVARVGRITGSRIDDLLAPPTTRASTRKGISYPAGSEAQCKEDYRRELVIERIYGRAADHYTSQYMKDGSDREPQARMLYEAENQVVVEQVGFALHPEWDWFGCSPDGLVGEDGGLELKCPAESMHDAYWQNIDLLVQEYKGQCLGGLICFPEREWWDLYAFNPYANTSFLLAQDPENDGSKECALRLIQGEKYETLRSALRVRILEDPLFDPRQPLDMKLLKAPRFHRSDWAHTIAKIEDEAQNMNAQIEAEIQKRGLPPSQWRVMP